MKGSHYTEQQNAFIAEHYTTMTYPELAVCYNAKFGANMTAAKLHKKISYMGLPKKTRTYKTLSTPEIDAYLIENAFRFTAADLAEQVREKFGVVIATQTVTWRLNKLGSHRGKNFVPDGYIPRASKPIGTERIDKGRTVMVKVEQPDVWKPKAQVIMGYDPKKYQPVFLDGNSLNVTPDNIVVISKKVHARLAKNGWLNSSNEVLMSGIKWCDLFYAIKAVTE